MKFAKDPKNTTWTIKELSSFEIDGIVDEVSKYQNEWFIDTSRQETYLSHKDTLMYQLQFMDYDWYPELPVYTHTVNSFKTDVAQSQYNYIVRSMESAFDGKVVRSELVVLKANKKVSPHVDGGQMLNISRRCHIPIVTNDNVFFTVFKNRVNMKPGICYEINNGMPHSVENNSDLDRVHLILDILPNEYML
jgi:Aspartyl/Asparaginyl beta-hydroxylase